MMIKPKTQLRFSCVYSEQVIPITVSQIERGIENQYVCCIGMR
ncbi:MAG: hypothetical protein NTZ45_02935 [Methylococcales bacterium]|nr:hypothetical protein [Methylococcales bacterium]